ncbi:DmsE family decaheme c-type cytochrome [bacterium]|nr:DmsE family decaheme c-type cytochrome [bacterium]
MMNRCTIPRTNRVAALLGMAIFLAATVAWAGAGYVGSETCLDCHDEVGAAMMQTVHGRLANYQYPTDVHGCEACHGPGEKHADNEDPALIMTPSSEMGALANKACLGCHKTGVTVDWHLGVHADADLSCVSCHAVHGGELLAEDQTELCLGCHQEFRCRLSLPSHHPVKEHFMSCSDCHDVHGEGYTGLMTGESSRELCLECHTQHRGPFIFEHSPVEEDCMICHDPHGTVANNLLRQNEPFLCLQCHQPHFHTALMSYDGEYVVPPANYGENGSPAYEGWSGESHPDSFKQAMLTKCSQCHMSIHGTDLPSQSIPGQGRALNR